MMKRQNTVGEPVTNHRPKIIDPFLTITINDKYTNMSRSFVRAIVLGLVVYLSVVIIYAGHFAGGMFRFVLSLLGIAGVVWAGQTVTGPSKSHWWLVIFIQPFMAVATLGMTVLFPIDPRHTPPSISILVEVFGLVAILLMFGYLLIATLYPIVLFLDARAVRRSTSQWQPNPYLYGGIGLLIYGNPLLNYVPPLPDGTWAIEVVTLLVSLSYLFRRFRHARTV